jgi:hypothetical protein
MSIRPVKKLVTSKPTLEGAGVHLHGCTAEARNIKVLARIGVSRFLVV